MPISAVDIFCGAGGLTHGLIMGGITVNAGIDIDPVCRYPYERNNNSRFIQNDISDLDPENIIGLFPDGDTKVMVGCAPCQPFSTYNQGRDTRSDSKWRMLYSFADIINDVRPEIVSMENVPQLKKHEVYDHFVDRLQEMGYFVTAHQVYCPQYGIPQTRKRLVLFASIYGPIELIPPTHRNPETYINVRETIGHLEPISAGETSPNDILHKASRLSELNLKRIRASRPGGTWKDWDEALVADCHKKERGTTYAGVYARMQWESPSPTITTQCYGFGNGRFGHPEQDRAITLREAALLQTFPVSYDFVEPDAPFAFKSIGRLIGNAVPVRLGEVIALSIRKHLEDHNG